MTTALAAFELNAPSGQVIELDLAYAGVVKKIGTDRGISLAVDFPQRRTCTGRHAISLPRFAPYWNVFVSDSGIIAMTQIGAEFMPTPGIYPLLLVATTLHNLLSYAAIFISVMLRYSGEETTRCWIRCIALICVR